MELIKGKKYIVGSQLAKEHRYTAIVGKVVILLMIYPARERTMELDVYEVCVEESNRHWYIQRVDLLPYIPESNEEGLYLLKGDL